MCFLGCNLQVVRRGILDCIVSILACVDQKKSAIRLMAANFLEFLMVSRYTNAVNELIIYVSPEGVR
jgi:hypothetical protein